MNGWNKRWKDRWMINWKDDVIATKSLIDQTLIDGWMDE